MHQFYYYATLVILVFTAIVLYLTLRVYADIKKLMEQELREAVRPVVQYRWDDPGIAKQKGKEPNARLVNVGRGVAFNIRARSRSADGALSPVEASKSINNIPNESHDCDKWKPEFLKPAEVWIDYEDAFGRPYHSHHAVQADGRAWFRSGAGLAGMPAESDSGLHQTPGV